MMEWKIPLFDTDYGQEEITAVVDTMRSGWLTMGEKVKQFENQFAELTGVKHAIAVTNCTAALHLAYQAVGLRAGDDVICPSLTFVATANAVKYTGANPVFADVKSLDECVISLETIKKARTPKTKAICVVHYAGYPCEMDAISRYATQENLHLIEDCAHAPGLTYRGQQIGSRGDIGCFSFFSNKNLSTGEGGMVTTHNDHYADKIRLLRSHGMTTVTLDRHKGHAFSYDVVDCGYNYRPTEITAAIGIAQLKKLALNNEKRRDIVNGYREKLREEVPEVHVPFLNYALNDCTAHIMPVLLPIGVDRQSVMRTMSAAGIQTSIHYRPLHTFSAYSNQTHQGLEITETIGNRVVTLPLFPAMRPDDIVTVVTELKKAIAQ